MKLTKFRLSQSKLATRNPPTLNHTFCLKMGQVFRCAFAKSDVGYSRLLMTMHGKCSFDDPTQLRTGIVSTQINITEIRRVKSQGMQVMDVLEDLTREQALSTLNVPSSITAVIE